MKTATAVAVLLGLVLTSAVAETVYKHVDPEGRVTYSSEPPQGEGRSTEIEVDSSRNVIDSETTPELRALEQKQRLRRDSEQRASETEEASQQRRRAEAEQRLRAAEQAWEEGQASRPGDFLGRKDGGVRPSPQRLQRLQQLERELEEARRALF